MGICWATLSFYSLYSYLYSRIILLFIVLSTIFAFNQEIFQAEHYKSLSGTMEIQGQLTQVISGAAASFLIEIVSLKWILLVDMLTLLEHFSFLMYTVRKEKRSEKKINI